MLHDNYYYTDSDESGPSWSSAPSESQSSQSHEHLQSTLAFQIHASRRSIRDLKHYRIVFAEVGTPVHSLPDLKSVFEALRDACEGKSFYCRCIAMCSFACRSAVAFPSRLRASGRQLCEHSISEWCWKIVRSGILQED